MKIAIACDHGGLLLKEALIPYIKSLGHSVEDFGTHSLDSCDYPDYAIAAAKAVAKGKCDRGIVLCTTGIGVSIAANKVHGIRCALLCDEESARMTRMHNDTNMMALGASVVGQELAFDIVNIWLSTPFSREVRHQRRINKVMDLEREEKKKTARKLRRRRPRRIGGIAGNLIGGSITSTLSVILVLSMLLTPIATYVTNMSDPETLVSILFESGVFDGSNETEPTPTDDPGATEPGTTEPGTTEPGTTEPGTTDPGTTEPGTTEPENANVPAAVNEPENTEPENTEPENTEPENTEPENTEPENTEPTEPDHAGEADNAVNSLLGFMGSLTGTGIIDTTHLNEFLDLPEGTEVDTGKLGEQLATSGAAQALVSAYMNDVMNTAMGVESEPTLTPETAMTIIAPHMGELADIVQGSLPEGIELDRDHLEEIMGEALEMALPELVANLPDLGTAAAELLQSDNPVISTVTGALRFIRTGALRAAVMLVVVAMCALICFVRLPGLRGVRTVGICGVIGGALCYGATLMLHKLPELTTVLSAEFAEFATFIDLFTQVLVPFTAGLEEAFKVCAIVYAVVGVALILGTTVLRGFFALTFGRFFSDED